MTSSAVPFLSASPGNRKSAPMRAVTARHTRAAVHRAPVWNEGKLPIEAAHTVLPSSGARRPSSVAAAPAVNHPAIT